MRKGIEFPVTDGTILSGWQYLPGGLSGRHPTIIMAHGFSAVKEMSTSVGHNLRFFHPHPGPLRLGEGDNGNRS
ncbi:hypothetical protein [Desulfatirhabdium butyrativorans]|uniref:hypothetical protein n=1 Tax=Desulfatirhabdium butyrativorans TaxID=340467 RepID=UPI000404474E|nr:hypothetical protein [Desulfatirhabdium butyrativorans]